jgi:xylulose-5-phosphate/fructose-6-phosphate phosphoketolase
VNTLLSIGDHCMRSTNYVNLIVVDKQPHLQYLTMEQAIAHCTAGVGEWEWASTTEPGEEPDLVIACAGDVPTQEALAATDWLKRNVPELKIRFVNVVDLMAMITPDRHPHGMDTKHFEEIFTWDKPVVFAFHGYRAAIHEIIHGRPNSSRFHVHGFQEQGTTTTPFNMVVMNEMSRFHLAKQAIRRGMKSTVRTDHLQERLDRAIQEATAHALENFEDPADIRDWTWQG